MNRVKQCPNCSTMLRFPVTQGTILVQCPVCSHRFTFDPEFEADTNFQQEEFELPNLKFQPSFQNYKDLVLDLLYAPIDYLKSKQKPGKKEITWIPILLFLILALYVWKWSSVNSNESKTVIEKEPFFQEDHPLETPPTPENEDEMESPLENNRPNIPKKPNFEI